MVLGFKLIMKFIARMFTGDSKEDTVGFRGRKWLEKWVRVVDVEEILGNGLYGN